MHQKTFIRTENRCREQLFIWVNLMVLMFMRIERNNSGGIKPICKLKLRMHTVEREDLLRYLKSEHATEKKSI